MKNYFEGLYFKQQAGECALAFIPAVHRNKNGSSASLQIVSDKTAYITDFPIESVKMDRKGPAVNIGNNRFSLDGIHLDARGDGFEIFGDLEYRDLLYPKYDIMGPFKYVPLMECRHSVFSVMHKVSGKIELNGRKLDFDSGTGYIEGDRGCSFPKRYLWSQCLHGDISLMLSVAEIPFMGFRFTGIIGIVNIGGQEYRIATYLGAKPVFVGSGAAVIRQRGYSLAVQKIDGKGELLAAPLKGAMSRRIHESISSSVRFRFSRGKSVLFDFTDDHASFEDEYL